MNKKPFNILVVDDHSLVRRGVISLLKEEESIVNIYEAESGNAALLLIKEMTPEIVLMDISLPDMTGIDVIRQIYSIPGMNKKIKFLVISIFDSPEYYYRVIKAGALGLLPKNISPDILFEGIYKVLQGEMYFGPKVSAIFIEEIMNRFNHANFSSFDPDLVYFTIRERDILPLIFHGFQNKRIGEILTLSERTIESHRETLMKKLNVKNLAELAGAVRNSDKLTKLIDAATQSD